MNIESTKLKLPTREGAVLVEFAPVLESDQYAEVYRAAQFPDYEYDLTLRIEEMAKRWGSQVTIEPAAPSWELQPTSEP